MTISISIIINTLLVYFVKLRYKLFMSKLLLWFVKNRVEMLGKRVQSYEKG